MQDKFEGHINNDFSEAIAEIGKIIKKFDDKNDPEESCSTIAFLFAYIFDSCSDELLTQIAIDLDSMLNGRGLEAEFDEYNSIIGYEPIGPMDPTDEVDTEKQQKKEEQKRKKRQQKDTKKFRKLTTNKLLKHAQTLLENIYNQNKSTQNPPPS